MVDGNDAQREMIFKGMAQQLMEEWKREEEAKKSPFNLTNLTSIVALAISVGTLVWQSAVTTQRVETNTSRLEKLESGNLAADLARLEAKVDLLLEDRARGLSGSRR